MDVEIGKCGACGGRVIKPTIFYSLHPPRPRCENCGKTPQDDRPVIKMEK